MSRLPALILMLTLVPATALAQSEKDWKVCRSDDDKPAIEACTRVIASGKLSRRNYAIAYYNRALSYRRRRDFDRALADYSKAIELDGKLARAYANRGDVYRKQLEQTRAIAEYEKASSLEPKRESYHDALAFLYTMTGQYERAIASATQAIALDPKDADPWLERGLSQFFGGNFGSAASDMRRAIDLGDSATAMLYRYAARARAGENAGTELEADAGRLKSREWPYAVIEMYLGKREPGDTLAAASGASQRCDAHFHIGQHQLVRSDRTAALISLKAAADVCAKDDFEQMGARAELKRLGG